MAGVGIYFQVEIHFCRLQRFVWKLTSCPLQDATNGSGEVVVNHIITGGSADRSGIIQLGDIVVSVDSRDIRGKV